MRAVIQRVTQAAVRVDGKTVAETGPGLLVLLGVAETDTESDVRYLAGKIANLRLFSPEGGFDKSAGELKKEILVVSQFTLLADCRKGRRPSFVTAAKPEKAKNLYELFIFQLKSLGLQVKSGQFQATMQVSLTNDGPVTIILDSSKEK